MYDMWIGVIVELNNFSSPRKVNFNKKMVREIWILWQLNLYKKMVRRSRSLCPKKETIVLLIQKFIKPGGIFTRTNGVLITMNTSILIIYLSAVYPLYSETFFEFQRSFNWLSHRHNRRIIWNL